MLALAPNNTSHISQKQAGDATWRLIHFSLAGLVVDYSAHIAHMFMTSKGTKRERAATAVTDMGSGVFSGAFTTFIGFLVSDLPCNVRRQGGQSLVIGGSSLVILEGNACNPL